MVVHVQGSWLGRASSHLTRSRSRSGRRRGRGRHGTVLTSYGYGEHRVPRTIEVASAPRSGPPAAGGGTSGPRLRPVPGWVGTRNDASRLACRSDAVPRAGSDSKRTVSRGMSRLPRRPMVALGVVREGAGAASRLSRLDDEPKDGTGLRLGAWPLARVDIFDARSTVEREPRRASRADGRSSGDRASPPVRLPRVTNRKLVEGKGGARGGLGRPKVALLDRAGEPSVCRSLRGHERMFA